MHYGGKVTATTRKNGISFPFVLFLSVLIFVTGLGFLSFVQRDSRLQLHSQQMNRAFTLARSGLDYFTFQKIENPGAFPAGSVNGPYELEKDHFFQLTANPDGGCTCRAWISSGGQVVAERTLILPGNHRIGGDRTATYDPHL